MKMKEGVKMARLSDSEYQKKVVDKTKELRKKMEGTADLDNPEKINPLVVALLVSPDGEEIFSYRSEALDGDHAEFNLFFHKIAGEDHSRDTLFVSLEPCNHDSRLNSISCSELIVKAKIKEVFIGAFDPDILVRGNGYAYLKENKVKVSLFEEKYQKELIDENWPFFKDKLYCNENSRRFVMMYKEFLSIEAIAFYLSELKDNVEKITKEEYMERDDIFELLYEKCMEKKYIFNSISNGKRIVSSDIGFKIAFYSNPSNQFKGAYIKVIDNHLKREEESKKFDKSLIVAYSEAYEYILSILEKIANNELIKVIVREMLANAVFHKDYESCAPIIVKIFNDRIEITNPCKKEYIDLKYLNKFKMPTNPINGCLTEIAMDMQLMEGQGRGEETLEKLLEESSASYEISEAPYELISNILKVTIPVK